MKKQRKTIPLSNGFNGIDRFSQDQAEGKADIAFDCFNQAKDLTMRGGFRSVTHGNPFLLHAFRARVATETVTEGFSITGEVDSGEVDQLTINAGAEEASAIFGAPGSLVTDNVGIIYVGASIPFDTIYFPFTGAFAGAGSASRFITPFYWNGTTWVEITHFTDSTPAFINASGVQEPLVKRGYITFSHNQIPLWATNTINDTTLYWIRLSVTDAAGLSANLSNLIGTDAPHVCVGLLPRINGLFPLNLGGRKMMLIGNDGTNLSRGGASLAKWPCNKNMPIGLDLTHREASGIYGQQTMASWTRSSGGTSGGGVNVGTTDLVQDHTAGIDLRRSNVSGALVADASQLVVDVVDLVYRSSLTFTNVPGNFTDEDLEHYILYCLTGANAGNFRVITRYDAANFTMHFNAWTNVLNTTDTFILLRPMMRYEVHACRNRDALEADLPSFPIQPVAVTTAGTVQATTFQAFAPASDNEVDCIIADKISQGPVAFKLQSRLRFTVDGGQRWDCVYEPGAKKAFLTNGNSGVLEFDGETLKSFTLDYSSDLAKKLSGIIADQSVDATGAANQNVAGSALRNSLPGGKYLATFGGSLILTGDPARPNDIYHSIPGGGYKIWPYLYTSTIRDKRNEPISGITNFNGQLIAFTPSALHNGSMLVSGQLNWVEAANEGFAAHSSVQVINTGGVNLLVGPNSTGLMAWDGKTTSYLIDRWDRIIAGGINLTRLRDSVSAYMPSTGMYFCTLASPGSAVQDMILVYQTKEKAAFIWRYTHGVTALTVFKDSAGHERLFLGNENGQVAIMGTDVQDDWLPIEMEFKTNPLQPFGNYEGYYEQIALTMKPLGKGASFQLGAFINDGNRRAMDTTYPFTDGSATFGVEHYDGTIPYASGAFKSLAIGLRAGTKGHQIQAEIRSSNRTKIRALFLVASSLTRKGYD